MIRTIENVPAASGENPDRDLAPVETVNRVIKPRKKPESPKRDLETKKDSEIEPADAGDPEEDMKEKVLNKIDKERTSPKTITKNTLISALATGVGYAGLAGAIAVSGVVPGVALLPALGLAAMNGAVAGGGIYLGGEIHNWLWKTEDSIRPTGTETFARGVVSGITIPVGLAWNGYKLLFGKK